MVIPFLRMATDSFQVSHLARKNLRHFRHFHTAAFARFRHLKNNNKALDGITPLLTERNVAEPLASLLPFIEQDKKGIWHTNVLNSE